MLDEKGRIKRARKAGLASGKMRSKKHNERDKGLVLAFDYLSGNRQSKAEMIKALEFLTSFGRGVNLPKDVTVLRFLADGVGLTRQGVKYIVDKTKKQI